jgi:hypothetical protein
MYFALKNTFLQHLNKNNKIKFISIEDAVNLAEENNKKKTNAYNDLLNNIDLNATVGIGTTNNYLNFTKTRIKV